MLWEPLWNERRQDFDISSIADIEENVQQEDQPQESQRMQYPSTHKEFQTFDRLKSLRHNGNMLTSDARSEIYWDRAKVIVEMPDA